MLQETLGGCSHVLPPSYNPPPLPYLPPAGAVAPQVNEHIHNNPRPTGSIDNKPPGGPPPAFKGVDGLPELPSVPMNSLPPGVASSSGEDVDFDELTKRFEDLKKRK